MIVFQEYSVGCCHRVLTLDSHSLSVSLSPLDDQEARVSAAAAGDGKPYRSCILVAAKACASAGRGNIFDEMSILQ